MSFRCLILLSVGILAVSINSVHADEGTKPTSPKGIFAKARKAFGKVGKLKANASYVFSGTGVFYGMGDPIKYQGQWIGKGLNSKMVITMQFGDQTIQLFEVLQKDKGWTKLTGLGVKDMSKDEVKEKIAGNYVTAIIPSVFANSKGYKLSLDGELQIKGKNAVSVRVSKKGRPDVTLYFDKKTWLVVKSERPGINPKTGNEYTEEIYYSDYKKVDGVMQATKLRVEQDGKLYVTANFTNLRVGGEIDKKTFEKP